LVGAAALPFEKLESGATLVEINQEGTPVTPRADYVLRGPTGEVVPLLIRELSE
jgi:NAD-dependent deacetylase